MTTGFNPSSKIPVDPWDYPNTDSGRPRRPPSTPSIVRDDWEDDDDDDNDASNEANADTSTPLSDPAPPSGADDNRKIWEAANAKVAAPMPVLLTSPTSSVVPPPAAAFQPSLRILKRPQNSTPSQESPTPSPPPGGSLQDREARYAAARERIFGAEAQENGNKRTGDGSGSGKSSPSPKQSDNSVKILREPKAPEPLTPGKQSQSQGFKGRGGKAPPSTRISGTS